MPLRDHFHLPLRDSSPWSTVHSNWAVKIVDRLNGDRLSDEYKAVSGQHFGAQIEADVATLERNERGSLFEGLNGHDGGGVATATEVYSPPAVELTADVAFDDPDLFEVKIFRGGGGWDLVAAVELVSPANKDRDDHRRAFAVKCGSYLQKGVSVVVVDTVTTHSANLHDGLCDLIDAPAKLRWSPADGISVVAYRAVRLTGKAGVGGTRLNVLPYPLALGGPLPTVPLWLARDLAVPLELELTYEAACRSLRIA